MTNYDPYSSENQPPVRRRRSDRHRQAGVSSAPSANISRSLPEEQEDAPQEIQWQRRQPASWPEENAPAARGSYSRVSDPAPDDGLYMRHTREQEDDFEDEEDVRRFPWLKILGILLAAAAVFFAALFFMKDAGPFNPLKNAITGLFSGPTKAPGEVLSFQAASDTGSTNTRMLFSVTTNQSVDGVKLEDAEGNEIAGTTTLVNGPNETNKIWNINAIFDVPYTGAVYAVIREGETWRRTEKYVSLVVTVPTPVPTDTPVPTQAPSTDAPTAVPTDVPMAVVLPLETADPSSTEAAALPVITWAPTNPPPPTEEPSLYVVEETTEEPTAEPTAAPTEEPTEEPTPAPTAVPTVTPTPTPTPLPTATPVPRLDANPGSGSLKSTENVYAGGKTTTVSRTSGYVAPNPDNYSFYASAGVLTFRGDNFRRNAAYGTVNVEKEQLSVLWSVPLGSLKTADNGTLYGVGWTGQPAIVKWTKEVREGMNLYDEKKATEKLREVIFGAQDGKIYFLDLTDGSATRDPINVGFPLKGSVSIDSYDRPLLAVGQGISKLPNKTGSIGLHIYNLVDGKEAYFLNGRKSNSQVQYSTNGAFDGTALFLKDNRDVDALIVAGENGLLYTLDLNANFEYPNRLNPSAVLSMSIKPTVLYLRTKVADEKEAQVSVESSVAMYDKYIYMADTYGVIRCVDSDTMKTVWAMDGGDNIDAAIALDMDSETSVSLYTGNTAYSRLGSKKNVTIRRMNALTGTTLWTYEIKCDYDKNQLSGCKASPVIGQNKVSDLVFFTVNKVSGGGSKLLALDKQSGALVWEYAMKDEAISSPVAVYNDKGDAWIVQGDEGGNLTMLNARTGSVRCTLNLGGPIEASPAVYKNYLVIGTCGRNNASMYCLKIE